jgi:AhpD family alkylhydroperoxidase
MNSAVNLYQRTPETIEALNALETLLLGGGIEQSLIDLVRAHASQINGCAFCINTRTQDAHEHCEAEQRVYRLNPWREAPFHTERERVALAWTEAVTLVSEMHAPEEIYDEVREYFSEAETMNLTMLIATVNVWNWLAVSFRAASQIKVRAATAV